MKYIVCFFVQKKGNDTAKKATKNSQKQAEYFEAGKGSGIGKPNHCGKTPTGSAVRGVVLFEGVWCCFGAVEPIKPSKWRKKWCF